MISVVISENVGLPLSVSINREVRLCVCVCEKIERESENVLAQWCDVPSWVYLN